MMMRGPSRDNGDTHNFREWQPQLLIHKCHHCPLRTRIEMKNLFFFIRGLAAFHTFTPRAQGTMVTALRGGSFTRRAAPGGALA